MCVSGRVLFLGSMRRRKGEGVVYSLFPGYMCIPILPNPGLQLPGGAENYNSAPNCHFRAGFDSRGDAVWSNYPAPEKAQPITQIPPSEAATRYTQQKNTFQNSTFILRRDGIKIQNIQCVLFTIQTERLRAREGRKKNETWRSDFIQNGEIIRILPPPSSVFARCLSLSLWML